MPSSFVRSRSTRRTATVTTSAPDASIASIICAFDAYLPVPTISRERNSCPAITSGWGSISVSGEIRSACAISAPAHEVHDLEYVIRRELERSKGGSITHDDPVALDDHRARVELEGRQIVRQCPSRWDASLDSVHHQNDLTGSDFRH